MNESINKYIVVAVDNDGKRVLYNNDSKTFVKNVADATIFDDHDEAIDAWHSIDKSQYKRVFVPNYNPEVFKESVQNESAMSRVQMIAELKKVKPSYNYAKFTTPQIANMYNKYVLNPKPQKNVVEPQEEDAPVREKCAECNAYLNDMGTCPRCDDGEEDLDEAVTDPYEKVANKIVRYAKRDPERLELYDTYEEYVDEISYESVFEFPNRAPGFKPADVDNITDEEAAEFIDLLFKNTNLKDRLDEITGTGGNGHNYYGPVSDDLDDDKTLYKKYSELKARFKFVRGA